MNFDRAAALLATPVAKILIYAAQEVGRGRKQSIKSAIYGAAKRLQLEFETDYEQWVRSAHSLILSLYGAEIHGSFQYLGGWGAGSWLEPHSKGCMQDALLFAYEYAVTDMLAERETFFDDKAQT